MWKEGAHRLLARFGYRLIRVPLGFDARRGYTLFSYLDENGEFDYERYRQVQEAGNKRKICDVWVRRPNVEFIADYLRARLGRPAFGLCHGTRQGVEQAWFSELLGCEVVGTEIASTAEQFRATVRWDFHEANPDWHERADFVYSNSLDHAYDPEKALDAWMDALHQGGLCVIEHSSYHDLLGATALDPFGADIVQMPYLIATWGKGRYAVREILRLPDKPPRLRYLDALVVEKFAR